MKKEEPSLNSDDNDEQNETEEEETIALDESMDYSRYIRASFERTTHQGVNIYIDRKANFPFIHPLSSSSIPEKLQE